MAKNSTYPASSAALVGTYLHSWPGTSNGYTISLGTNTVLVDTGNGTAGGVRRHQLGLRSIS